MEGHIVKMTFKTDNSQFILFSSIFVHSFRINRGQNKQRPKPDSFVILNISLQVIYFPFLSVTTLNQNRQESYRQTLTQYTKGI